MSKQDFYELLGIDKKASHDDIKKAYRKLAMKYHPDKNPGDKVAEQKFRDISEAYEALKDDQKRAAYDRFGHAAFDQHGGAGPNGARRGGFNYTGSFADIFDEVFSEFTGGRHSQEENLRGSDIRYDHEISLEDAFKGVTSKLRYMAAVECDTCKGSGSANNKPPIECTTCHGRGRVRAQQGFFTVERPCPSCDGLGRKIETPCKTCHAAGRVRREKTVELKIPAGVDDGTRIRMAGYGEAGIRGGTAGDLYVFLSIHSHRLFKRQGHDILCRIPLPMTTAALGGEIEVPTIDGTRAKVKIPSGTQNAHQFRLRGKGMSILRSTNRGDMYIETLIETPLNLTKRQREILEEFDQISKHEANNPQSTGFFKKVKDIWNELGSK